jgi:hypothetical protein
MTPTPHPSGVLLLALVAMQHHATKRAGPPWAFLLGVIASATSR